MNTGSFIDLARRSGVRSIQIPILQRDYAQGRDQPDVRRIRDNFLGALHSALTGDEHLHLDFVYGEVTQDPIKGGTLVPLDGQQRLTTLFLLHWYLAARVPFALARDDFDQLPAFTYETRHSARAFCKLIVRQRPFPLPNNEEPSAWIRDQSWFVSTWRHDPTIGSMLVVLDAIHQRFGSVNCEKAWDRLVRAHEPAITFNFLSLPDMGLTDELYVKMNSRGKPLTDFENFKAGFEDLVQPVSEDVYREFCKKVDTVWSDLFWKVRELTGTELPGDLIDAEFMRYFRFVTDTLSISSHDDEGLTDLESARRVYSMDCDNAEANLDVLFHALDDWSRLDVAEWFNERFTDKTHEIGKVAIFDPVDLFRTCCTGYGKGPAGFPRWKMVMLSAVLLHLRTATTDFPSRVRTLRNLALNSQDELGNLDHLPGALHDAGRVMSGEVPTEKRSFNQRQIDEEKAKRAFIALHPALAACLHRLEDHPLLRGCLAAFELDAGRLERRAKAFEEIFSGRDGLPPPEARAALLACGDYSQRNRSGKFQFAGQSLEIWRQLLTRGGHFDFGRTVEALRTLLDAIAAPADGSIEQRLRLVIQRYCASQVARQTLDWRYYLVRYDKMRSGISGLYVGSGGVMGYSLCMLDKQRLSSDYRDPYLLAIVSEGASTPDKDFVDPRLIFSGPESRERWLELKASGVRIRCGGEGVAVTPPTNGAFGKAFAAVKSRHGIDASGLRRIRSTMLDGKDVDTEDRVELGARLVTDLVAMVPC